MPTILIVDDEEQIRRVIAAFLAKMGFKTIEASGGQEAIALLQAGSCLDLMILDMKMPGVKGMDVLREKKKNEQ